MCNSEASKQLNKSPARGNRKGTFCFVHTLLYEKRSNISHPLRRKGKAHQKRDIIVLFIIINQPKPGMQLDSSNT